MAHSVSEAAANAVKKSQRVEKENRTTDQVISDVRKLLDARLSVPPLDLRLLLDQYDMAVNAAASLQQTVNDDIEIMRVNVEHSTSQLNRIDELKAQVATLKAQVATLTDQNEQFRTVYELENRNTEVRVDVLKNDAAEGDD